MKDKDFAKVYERNYKRSFLFAKSYVHDDLVAEDIAAIGKSAGNRKKMFPKRCWSLY